MSTTYLTSCPTTDPSSSGVKFVFPSTFFTIFVSVCTLSSSGTAVALSSTLCPLLYSTFAIFIYVSFSSTTFNLYSILCLWLILPNSTFSGLSDIFVYVAAFVVWSDSIFVILRLPSTSSIPSGILSIKVALSIFVYFSFMTTE